MKTSGLNELDWFSKFIYKKYLNLSIIFNS